MTVWRAAPGLLRPPGIGGIFLLGTLIAIEGLVATHVGWAPFEFRRAVLALMAGWTIAAGGLAAWALAPAARTGPLLVACGASSFAGPLLDPWVHDSSIVSVLAWGWTAILGHAILGHPGGRLRTPTSRLLAGGLYLVPVTITGADPWPAAIALGAVLLARRLVDGTDPRRAAARIAGAFAVIGMAAPTVLAQLAPGLPVDGWALAAAGPAAAAVVLAAGEVRLTPSPVHAADAVLRLSDRRLSILDELRRATGDPTLDLAVAGPPGQGHVDLRGRPIALPPLDGDRIATPIALPDGSSAVAIHDHRLETDRTLVAAAGRAVAFAGANARLQAELRAQVADVEASRRRLVVAADAERAGLERRLAAEVEPHLEALSASLPDEEPAHATLGEVRDALARLATGLHPTGLDDGDLARALDLLAARSPIPVRVDVSTLPALPPPTATAAWFSCSEAITNAIKHAGATGVDIHVHAADGMLVVRITDDGVGGADPTKGSGLRGLDDRARALGGRFAVSSGAGLGTVIDIRLPVTGSPG